MRFRDFILVGFNRAQMQSIRKVYSPGDLVGLDLVQNIADITGCVVGLAIAPGEPLKIIRMG